MPERRLDVDDPNWGLANHFQHGLVRTTEPTAAERKSGRRWVTRTSSGTTSTHVVDCGELAHQIIAEQDAARARALQDSFRHHCEGCGRPVLRDRRLCTPCRRSYVDVVAEEQSYRDTIAVFARFGRVPPPELVPPDVYARLSHDETNMPL